MSYSIADIRRGHRDAGGFFFEPKTMKHWGSRILSTVYEGKGGVFFITSELPEGSRTRRYTVRQFHPDTGRVTTPQSRLDEYRHHPTREGARAVAVALAKSPENMMEARPAPGEETDG